MGKIFCLMGKSSTGKDTIYQELLKKEDLHLHQIVSYTTRPIRANETDGVEYHFCTKERKEELLAQGNVIEIRSYETVHGIWDYFTVADDQIRLEQKDYLIIGTLESDCKIRDYFGREKVIPVYIEVEDGTRLMRAVERERRQSQPKYRELCRRFLADDEDFSEEKLRAAGIEQRFVNENLEDTLERISSYIKEQL